MSVKKNLQSKKDKVLGQQKNSKVLLIGFAVLVVAIVGAIFVFKGDGNKAPAGGQNVNVGAQDTSTGNIPMTDVKAELANGKLAINMNDVKTNRIVRFEDQNATLQLKNGETVPLPLVAFVSTKGDIKVAIADCEPCSSTRFHIEGDKLVCNACGTSWTLDDLQGVSGGCTQYPPDQKAYKVDGSKIVIDESLIKNWKPRA